MIRLSGAPLVVLAIVLALLISIGSVLLLRPQAIRTRWERAYSSQRRLFDLGSFGAAGFLERHRGLHLWWLRFGGAIMLALAITLILATLGFLGPVEYVGQHE